jgi:hypothetical protein
MPIAYARAIADDRTLAGRRLHLHRVPPAFLGLVTQTAALMLAGKVLELRDVEARRTALAEIPEELRDLVEAHVRRVFQARAELRGRERRREAGSVELDLDFA